MVGYDTYYLLRMLQRYAGVSAGGRNIGGVLWPPAAVQSGNIAALRKDVFLSGKWTRKNVNNLKAVLTLKHVFTDGFFKKLSLQY